MKFQYPSLNFLNGRMDAHTHTRMDMPKPICSPVFSKLGHKKLKTSVPSQNGFLLD